MTLKELEDKIVEVGVTQTTYVQVKTDNKSYKISFINKKEFELKKGTVGELLFYEDHPLLIDFNEILESTYIGSKAEDAELVADEVKKAIEEVTLGWRPWTTFFVNRNAQYGYQIFMNNLKTGSGKILDAPPTITKKVVEVLHKHSIVTSTLDSRHYEIKKSKLLLIGNNYVIAEDFKVVEQ
ncbi:hypothetical protein [Rufibacter aurantiacus]|uniref:hypothetical protein n=1 Tax=Rufibacter aurantiacus TaxID=2817374 RepID=UPI001B309E06|nr:hypothetical protein [Rufibacter aurantiacus]